MAMANRLSNFGRLVKLHTVVWQQRTKSAVSPEHSRTFRIAVSTEAFDDA